jgi:sugar (pentulose or hexulose) kinase
VRRRRAFLGNAKYYLGFPDLFNYWLTGEKRGEYTHASTTQCFNPSTQSWDADILEAISVSPDIFPQIVYPGSILGAMKHISVSVPACHDTGSAVVAVPTTETDFVYLSSGTWSLMGAETKNPVINDRVYDENFTNEAGAGMTNRLLRNLPGLWFEQELMREWASKGSPVTHEDLSKMAEGARPFRSLIDPSDTRFFTPGEMTPRIVEYCREHGMPEPQSMGEHIRCVYDSLALNYRNCLAQLEYITSKHYTVIHVLGGGSLNGFLNQLTAEVTGRNVIAGPVEAATLGNAIVQYMSLGFLRDIAEARGVLRETLELSEYAPMGGLEWENAYTRYREMIRQ